MSEAKFWRCVHCGALTGPACSVPAAVAARECYECWLMSADADNACDYPGGDDERRAVRLRRKLREWFGVH